MESHLTSQRLFENACREHLEFHAHRYLLSVLRCDGVEKAEKHREMCAFYVGVFHNTPAEDAHRNHLEDYKAVHEATRDALTDRMDEVIGFNLDRTVPSREELDNFLRVFHSVAVETLSARSGGVDREVFEIDEHCQNLDQFVVGESGFAYYAYDSSSGRWLFSRTDPRKK